MYIKPLFIAMTLCGAICSNTWAQTPEMDGFLERIAEPASPKNILVLLEQGVSEALLEVKGPYFIYNPHDGTKVSSGQGKRYMVHSTPDGLKWGEEFPGLFQFYLLPKSSDTAIFINGVQYTGAVAVYSIAGRLNIVNDIDIESYVKGQLSAQVSQPMENEVLAALAILARTNAYYSVSKNEDAFWQVLASDTGFQGSALASSTIEKAVDSTRHLILVHPTNGKSLPFATAWTEHSAGKTAAYQTMFRKDALAPSNGVDAPHAALDRKETKWTTSLSKKTLAHLLDIPAMKSAELFIDPTSQKVYGIRIKSGDEVFDFDFFTIQDLLGKERLPSSDFSMNIKDETITFTGYGRGHGVGLCLYSANSMAQNGDHAVKILSKFFPETYLLNLNALPKKREGAY